MKNPVMDYNQFMAAFKGASAGYSKRANVANGDAKAASKVKQDLANDPIKGKGTAHLDRFTKSHLNMVKSKKSMRGGSKK